MLDFTSCTLLNIPVALSLRERGWHTYEGSKQRKSFDRHPMGKPSKSSATSGTKKKHARKANPQEQPLLNIGKGPKGKEKKAAKNAPKIKMYIPPPKYQALQQDPVDSLGLATALPPELIVTFRKLMKRDAVTKRRALEEFQIQWIGKYSTLEPQSAQDEGLQTLHSALPIWVSSGFDRWQSMILNFVI